MKSKVSIRSIERRSGDRKIGAVRTSKGQLARPAFEALVVENIECAYRMSRAMLARWGAYMETDELHSVAHLALCEAAKAYDPLRGASFPTFLFHILRGHVLKELRSRIRSAETLVTHEQSEETMYTHADIQQDTDAHCPMQELVRTRVREKFEEALPDFNALEQEVLLESVIGDLKIAKLARAIGYSRGHLSEVKSRALQKLRVQFYSMQDDLPLAA